MSLFWIGKDHGVFILIFNYIINYYTYDKMKNISHYQVKMLLQLLNNLIRINAFVNSFYD